MVGAFSYKVELYSPNGKCQTQLALLPNAPVFRPSLAFIDGKIITCSAYSPNIKSCWIYNNADNKWTLFSSLIYTHTESPGIVFDNKIYILDGPQSEVFDPRGNLSSTWPAPTKQIGRWPCLIVWKDTILVIGGWIQTGELKREGVQSYNTSSKQWTVLQGNFVHERLNLLITLKTVGQID